MASPAVGCELLRAEHCNLWRGLSDLPFCAYAAGVDICAQVVRATVVNVAPNGRIKLSLSSKAANVAAAAAADPVAAAAVAIAAAATADPLGGLQPGDTAEAVVVEVQEAAAGAPGGTTYLCRLEAAGAAGGGGRARLDAAHLSDHPAAVAAFREVVRAGSRLGG